MDFTYAPPPPPQTQSNRQNRNKKGPNNKPGLHQHQQLQKSNHHDINTPASQQGESPLFDLPVHLPNSIPNAITPALNADGNNNIDRSEEETTAEPSQHHQPQTEPTKSNASTPTYIPGTTITLTTEEDIAKWIEERKKRWPTNKRVELKNKQQIEQQQKQQAEQQQQQQLGEQDSQQQKRPHDGENDSQSSNKRTKRICRFYQQHKRCKFGQRCTNLHQTPSTPSSSSHQQHSQPQSSSCHVKLVNNVPVNIPKRFTNDMYVSDNAAGQSSLYKMLVSRDLYSHENELALDFIQFLSNQGLVDMNVRI